jgi:hypothetical protein
MAAPVTASAEAAKAVFHGPVQQHIEAALASQFAPTHCVVTNES